MFHKYRRCGCTKPPRSSRTVQTTVSANGMCSMPRSSFNTHFPEMLSSDRCWIILNLYKRTSYPSPSPIRVPVLHLSHGVVCTLLLAVGTWKAGVHATQLWTGDSIGRLPCWALIRHVLVQATVGRILDSRPSRRMRSSDPRQRSFTRVL